MDERNLYAVKEVEGVLLQLIKENIGMVPEEWIRETSSWLGITCIRPIPGIYHRIKFWSAYVDEEGSASRFICHNDEVEVCFFEKDDGTFLVVTKDEEKKKTQERVLKFLRDKQK